MSQFCVDPPYSSGVKVCEKGMPGSEYVLFCAEIPLELIKRITNTFSTLWYTCSDNLICLDNRLYHYVDFDQHAKGAQIFGKLRIKSPGQILHQFTEPDLAESSSISDLA